MERGGIKNLPKLCYLINEQSLNRSCSFKFQSEIEAYKKSRDETEADRENEIRRIFSDPLNTSGSGQDNPEANMSMENDRLKNDLNQVAQSFPTC